MCAPPDGRPEDQIVLLSSAPSDLSDVYDSVRGRYFRLDLPPLSSDVAGAPVIGVMDSGVLSHHPDLAPRLVGSRDFTGTGPEDEQGHGTKVALLLAAHLPQARLFNIKVLSPQARSAQTLLEGLRWLAEEPPCLVVNLSAGVYRPACQGDCDVCEAARRAASAGVTVVAAAGNWRGLTACPAKASDAVMAVAEIDSDTGRLAATSSPAGLEGVAAFSPGRAAGRWTDAEGC